MLNSLKKFILVFCLIDFDCFLCHSILVKREYVSVTLVFSELKVNNHNLG